MKTIAEQLAFYAAYHRHKWNVATHFVGIPAIIIGLLVPLGWLRVEVPNVPLTGALALIVVVAVYYLLLDTKLALSMLFFIVPAFYAADLLSRMPWSSSIGWFLVLFVGGWVLQFFGHSVFEKRKPAFVDNLVQLLIGPLFLMAEAVFFLGLRKQLQEDISKCPAPFESDSGQA